MSSQEKQIIKLVLINGRVMTFNPDDYLTLRKEYRIIGRLIGIAACYPKNVNLSHMPALYSEYEAKLMIEENIVILEEKINIKNKPTDQMKEDFEKHQLKVIEEYHKPYIDEKLKAVRSNMEQIIKGKRKKLIKSGKREEEINISEEEIIKDEERKVKQSMNPNAFYLQISTEYPFHSDVKLITDYPVKNQAKFKIFKDLWHKQFYVTNGECYGADFLTYPSDPRLFHSSQVIHVIDRNVEFDHHFLLSCNRISVTVKKKCVFAYLDEEENITYQTLEWINTKTRKEISENTKMQSNSQQSAVDSNDDESEDTEKEETEKPN